MALNSRQLAFTQEIAAGKSQVEAYCLAFPEVKRESARSAAARLMKNIDVNQEIVRLRKMVERGKVLSHQEKREWLAEFIRQPLSDTVKASDQHRAIEIDNKMAGHDFKDQPAGKSNPFLMLVGICGNSRDDADDETTMIEAEVVNS